MLFQPRKRTLRATPRHLPTLPKRRIAKRHSKLQNELAQKELAQKQMLRVLKPHSLMSQNLTQPRHSCQNQSQQVIGLTTQQNLLKMTAVAAVLLDDVDGSNASKTN